MRTKKVDTPWGLSDDAGTQIAPGITRFSTPSHGGIGLSRERWREFMQRLPGFDSFAGAQWLEEDADAIAIYIAWPELATEIDIFNAVRSFQWSERHHLIPAELLARANAFRTENAHLWERGSMSSGAGYPDGCWRVSFTRLGDKARQQLLIEYPTKQFYSDAELAALRQWTPAPRPKPPAPSQPDHDYAGAFDGVRVTSDADPGL